MAEGLDLENRVIVGQGVVAVVVAERAFGLSEARGYLADQSELRLSDQGMRSGPWDAF